MRYCVNCGAMNDTDAKYCSGCGKKFDSAPEQTTEKTDYTTGQQTQESAGYRAAGEEQSWTSGNTQNVYGAAASSFEPQGEGITENKYKGYSIASMILGIASIVLCFFIPFLPLAAAIVGLVLGNKAKRYGDNGMAKAGRITSIIGIVLIAVIVVVTIIAVIAFSAALIQNPDFVNNLDNIFDYYYNFKY